MANRTRWKHAIPHALITSQ